jgi:hypothetical protein
MPPEMEAFGERTIREAFEAAAPDYIILFHKDMNEYGVGIFGTDRGYGRALMAWIRGHYVTVEVLGHGPLTEGGDGIEILRTGGESAGPRPSTPVPARGG